jgi:hypothetical protein
MPAGSSWASLTPDQQAAVQAAVNQAGSLVPGGTTVQGMDNAFVQQLQGSGIFSPQQLQAFQQAGIWDAHGPNFYEQGGNPAPFDQTMLQQVQQNYGGDYSSLNSLYGNTGATAGTSAPQTPAQNAIAPTLSGGQGYNPLQPAYLPTPPTLQGTYVSPAGYNAATTGAMGYDPATLGQGLISQLGPQATIQALLQSVAPQYQQQDQQFMQQLAASGLTPGSTAGQTAFGNLAQQQLAGISPAIAQAIQGAQGNLLSAGNTNIGALNQAGQFNAGAGNAALFANQAALNQAGQYNAGNQQQAGLYNAGVGNQVANQNLANLIQQQQYNTGAYNTAGTNYFNALQGNYNTNLAGFNNLNQAGLSGANGLAGTQAGNAGSLSNTIATQYPVYGGATNFAPFGQYPTQQQAQTPESQPDNQSAGQYTANPYGAQYG